MHQQDTNAKPLPIRRKPSVCESCGEAFGCGAEAGSCWCAEVEVSEQVRAELRARFSGCLCRACLERFAAPRALDEAGDEIGASVDSQIGAS